MNAGIASTVPSDLKFSTNLSARPSGPNKPIVNNDDFGIFYVMPLRTFLFFSVVGLDKPGGISPFVSTACGFVSAEVNEADSSGRGSGHAPSTPFYVIRQKVPPNISKVRHTLAKAIRMQYDQKIILLSSVKPGGA